MKRILKTNLIISASIFILTTIFSINDGIYAWSNRLATVMIIHAVAFLLFSKLNLDKIKKSIALCIILLGLCYSLIMALFIKEHLSIYLSKTLTIVLMILVFVIGVAITLIYARNFKKENN